MVSSCRGIRKRRNRDMNTWWRRRQADQTQKESQVAFLSSFPSVLGSRRPVVRIFAAIACKPAHVAHRSVQSEVKKMAATFHEATARLTSERHTVN